MNPLYGDTTSRSATKVSTMREHNRPHTIFDTMKRKESKIESN
jgi:hypothetical protein